METVSLLIALVIGMCEGLSIDLSEMETSNCLKPSTRIICQSKTSELQAAGNKMMINHGSKILAKCDWDTSTCSTTDMHYNATIEGESAILIVKEMHNFYESDKWSCGVGDKTAALRLKYFRTEDGDFASSLTSLKNTSIVDFLTLIVVILIPIVFGIGFCRDFMRRKQKGAKTNL